MLAKDSTIIKVLLSIDSLMVGGKERQLLELAKGLAQRPGINCQVLAMSEEDQYTDLQDSGIIVHRLVRRVRHDWAVFLRVYGLLKKLRPNVVHSWDYMTAIYALPACKLLGIKFVNGAIRYSSSKLEPIIKAKAAVTFPFSDTIVSNSQAGLRAHQLLKSSKACVVYNGIDLSRFAGVNNGHKMELGITTEKVVGMVATFSEYKDYETYLNAAQQLVKSRKDVTFVAVGGGPCLEKMKQLVSPIYQDRVIFTGQRRDVEPLINIFDIGVLCSTKLGEGISNSIMEYMALNKPCIASDVGGTPELVVDGETGILVDCGDAEQLAQKIEYLLDNPVVAKQMGLAGRKRLNDQFNLEKMVSNYIDLYHKTLNLNRC
ncbi:MAG: glycosyltransferase [Candidatus Edwardsbacteria bacterium]|nr:glycosyltransferase [Candidatus Edwardsbacteria bacterium]